MISYLHVTSSDSGFFVHPTTIIPPIGADGNPLFGNPVCIKVGTLLGDGGEINVVSVHIPQECDNYTAFSSQMANTENILLHKINELAGDSIYGCET